MGFSSLLNSRFTAALALVLLLGACREENEPTPQQGEGPLEGVWKVRIVDPVMYNRQDRIVATYAPTDAAGYTRLTITGTELQYYDAVTNGRSSSSYVRQGNQLTCPPPERSYTIRKLTDKELDLYLRGKYQPYGNQETRIDFTIHFDRQ